MRIRRFRGVRPPPAWASAGTLLTLSLLSACEPERSDILSSIPESTVERDLRIDGHQAILLPIAWMGVGPDGRIALVQQQDASIRFFDANGEDLGKFGRSGGGPGEFRRPLRGGWLGDTLWIDDTQLDRTTLISPELRLVRTVPQPRSLRPAESQAGRIPEFGPGTPYAVYPGDTMLVTAFPIASDPLANVFNGLPMLRASADGGHARVVAERPNDESGSFFVPFSDGRAAGFPVPFHQGPRWTVSPDGRRIGILTVDFPERGRSSFRVQVVDELGMQIFDRTYSAPTEAIPATVIDSVISARAEASSNSEMRRAILTDLKDRVPPMYAPVRDIVIGKDGRVWVGIRPTPDGNPRLVLLPDGEPDRRVTLPTNVRLMVADQRHIWGLERDELDVESVVRYRLGS